MALRLVDGGRPDPIDFPLFDPILDRTGRRRLRNLVTPVAARRGEVIAEQGAVSRDLLVLAEGVVKLCKDLPDGRRLIVAFRAAGDPISLHRCDTPWPVSAEAVSDCTLFHIEWEPFHRFVVRYPAMARALVDLAGDEVASLQERLLLLGRKSTEEKLATFVLEFSRPTLVVSSLSREIQLPLRRSDIADYLALTTETVSRELSRLKRRRIIAMPRPSRIVVLNRPALEAAAQGLNGAALPEAPSRGLDTLCGGA